MATTQLFVSKKHTRWVDITCERSAAKGITGWRKFPITSGTLFATNTEEVPNPKAQTQKSKQRNQLCKPSKHKVEDRTSAQKIKWSFFRKKLNTQHQLHNKNNTAASTRAPNPPKQRPQSFFFLGGGLSGVTEGGRRGHLARGNWDGLLSLNPVSPEVCVLFSSHPLAA